MSLLRIAANTSPPKSLEQKGGRGGVCEGAQDTLKGSNRSELPLSVYMPRSPDALRKPRDVRGELEVGPVVRDELLDIPDSHHACNGARADIVRGHAAGQRVDGRRSNGGGTLDGTQARTVDEEHVV
jgi:hypothetical protein